MVSAGKRVRARKVDKVYGVFYGENEYGEHGVGYGETNKGTLCW